MTTTDTFNPGPGWVEVPGPNFPPRGVRTLREHDATGAMTAIWAYYPPLPAWTVARTPGGAFMVKSDDDDWYGTHTGFRSYPDESTLTVISSPIDQDTP